jgi:hypothetical protein
VAVCPEVTRATLYEKWHLPSNEARARNYNIEYTNETYMLVKGDLRAPVAAVDHRADCESERRTLMDVWRARVLLFGFESRHVRRRKQSQHGQHFERKIRPPCQCTSWAARRVCFDRLPQRSRTSDCSA